MFLIGYNSNNARPPALLEEIRKYDDIVLADFEDSYKNLSIKTTVALELIHLPIFRKSCQNQVKWMIIQDDDVYIKYRNVSENYKYIFL